MNFPLPCGPWVPSAQGRMSPAPAPASPAAPAPAVAAPAATWEDLVVELVQSCGKRWGLLRFVDVLALNLDRLLCGNQTWQWKIPCEWSFLRRITDKWSIFHCHIWKNIKNMMSIQLQLRLTLGLPYGVKGTALSWLRGPCNGQARSWASHGTGVKICADNT